MELERGCPLDERLSAGVVVFEVPANTPDLAVHYAGGDLCICETARVVVCILPLLNVEMAVVIAAVAELQVSLPVRRRSTALHSPLQ